MSGRRRLRLEAGAVELDLRVDGVSVERVDRLVSARVGAFVDRPRSPWVRRTIDCHIRIAGPAWQPYWDPHGRGGPQGHRLTDRTWFAEWCFYRGAFSRDRADIVVSDRDTALEHALRGAAVFGAMPHDALFFHAAALVFDGRAVLFPGHPGAGKSTIAREGRPDRVLANEIAICAPSGGDWVVLPSPFWGTGDRAEYSDPAPLGAIAVLDQAQETNVWTALSPARAVAAMAPHLGAQCAEHIGDDAVITTLGRMAGAVPTASLRWHRSSHPLEHAPWKL